MFSVRFATHGTLVLLSLGLFHCSKGAEDSKPSTQSKSETASDTTGAATALPPEKPKSLQPKGPTGSIKGSVTIVGETPEMPLLRRGADPKCDNGALRAETILVAASGGLQNVIVRIKPGTVPAWTPPNIITVDQKDCMYRPRVQGGVRGQFVEVKNSDETTHNVHARHLPLGRRQGIDTIINRAQPAGVSMKFELGEEPVAKLKCDFHGWMQGYVVVSDNPYFGVSKSDGTFLISGVPVGTHEVETWHEYYGTKDAKLVVEEGGEATLNIVYDAKKDDPMASKRGQP